MKDCATCGGTGRQILDRSWFAADGHYPARCGICAGTGKSDYAGNGAFVAEQARRRDAHRQPPKSQRPQIDVREYVKNLE